MTPEQVAEMKQVMVHGPLLLVFLVLVILFSSIPHQNGNFIRFWRLLFSAYGFAFLAGMPFKYIAQ